MRIKSCYIIVLLLTLLFSTELKAQDQKDTQNPLVSNLVKIGFENVGIHQSGKNVYLFYENRLYRSEIEGLSTVLKEASAAYNDSIVLHVVPLHHQVPLSVFTATVGTSKQLLAGPSGDGLMGNSLKISMNSDSIQSIQDHVRLQNSPRGRIDLLFLPGIRFQIGNFVNPIEKRISISPILQTSLWKGNLMSVEVLIPLFNDLQQKWEGDIRLETATINQLFRLPKNLFIYASGGIFPYTNKLNSSANFKRYGINTEVRKYFSNGRIATGANVGWTGVMNFSGGYFNYWPMDRINFALYGEYREPNFDLTTRLTAGKFLYDDLAVRLDISRQFHEFNFGLFIIKSNLPTISGELGTVGGLSLTIPIAPRKSFRPAPFRVNLAKYFNYEFRERTVDPLAISYKTNNDWNDAMRNLNPDFTGKQLLKP